MSDHMIHAAQIPSPSEIKQMQESETAPVTPTPDDMITTDNGYPTYPGIGSTIERPGASVWSETETIPRARIFPRMGIDPEMETDPEMRTLPRTGYDFEMRTIPRWENDSEMGTVPRRENDCEMGTVPRRENDCEMGTVPGTVTDSEMGTVPEIATVPGMGNAPEMATVPEMGNASEMGTIPGIGNAPEMATVPDMATIPRMGTVPEMATVPGMETAPEMATVPGMETNPGMATAPGMETNPEMGTVPEMDNDCEMITSPETDMDSLMETLTPPTIPVPYYLSPDMEPIDAIHAGALKVSVVSSQELIPIPNATVTIYSAGDPENPLETLITNISGQTDIVELPTPPLEWTWEPSTEHPYSEYNINVAAKGHEPVMVYGVEILADELSLLLIRMNPLVAAKENKRVVTIPSHTLFYEYPQKIPEEEIKPMAETGEIVLNRVAIPEFIIVHDGDPSDATAANYWVRYKDYIKNVASCEIYSTWPESTIYANILVIMSFTLNRVYTEW